MAVNVESFGHKVRLANSKHPVFKSQREFAKLLNIGEDVLSRALKDSRVSEATAGAIVATFPQIERRDWNLPLALFGKHLGISRPEIQAICGVGLPGFDFGSRSHDQHRVDNLYHSVGGYWLSYYASVSKTDRLVVTRDVVWFGPPDNDQFIPCAVGDLEFLYSGSAFEVGRHLYMFLEKEIYQNEIIVYMLNVPDRRSLLSGIILCKSEGDAFAALPCASKVVFRVLDEQPDSADPLTGLGELRSKFASYVEMDTEDDEEQAIFSMIDNTVQTSEVPRALRMELKKDLRS